MFKKLKLWYAQHQLKLAVQEEARLRKEAAQLRTHIIPALEKEAKDCELDLRLAEFNAGKLK